MRRFLHFEGGVIGEWILHSIPSPSIQPKFDISAFDLSNAEPITHTECQTWDTGVENIGNIVIAIGGNALIKPGEEGTIYEQFANARETCDQIVKLVKKGHDIVLTHGNGPQVGNALMRHENSKDTIPAFPLGMCVAETVGSLGYMLQQTMQNTVKASGLDKDTLTVITQVVVDKNDPSFKNPTKPIGQFYEKEEIMRMVNEDGWSVGEDSGRGWRRMVPSPRPVRIVEVGTIRELLAEGRIIIACGGGGLPVIELEDRQLDGVEAVIDKDYASSRLAQQLGTKLFIILTTVDRVSINFGKPEQGELDNITLSEAKQYLAEGQFPPGSMGPKMEAAIDCLEKGGEEVIITEIGLLEDALEGKAGTHVVR